MSAEPALRVENLHKSFGLAEVLRGIDLTVAEHEVVCLIGASGSGKSTLLRCINLLEDINAGRIWIEGRRSPAAASTWTRSGAGGDRLPGVQSLPAHDRAGERDAGPRKVLRPAARRGRGAGDGAVGPLRSGRRPRVSGPSLGRPAATGGDSSRAGDEARALLLDEITSRSTPSWWPRSSTSSASWPRAG